MSSHSFFHETVKTDQSFFIVESDVVTLTVSVISMNQIRASDTMCITSITSISFHRTNPDILLVNGISFTMSHHLIAGADISMDSFNHFSGSGKVHRCLSLYQLHLPAFPVGIHDLEQTTLFHGKSSSLLVTGDAE